MKKTMRIILLVILPVLAGCPLREEITGRVLSLDGPAQNAAVLGMVWIEDTDKAKPALITDGLNTEERNAAYEKDVTERGLPVAYARAFTDEKGWFTLDKFQFSGETKKAVKAMKQPRITRITLCAFQRGYLKGALTAFPKDEKELPSAVVMLFRPKSWKELSLDSSFSSLERPEYYNGYSKEFGATKEEKNWFLEYTHANLYKAYTDSDIKRHKEWESYCGHDYSDMIVSPAGMQRNPEREKCGELLKRLGDIRANEEFWGNHALNPVEWMETAKKTVKEAIAGLSADNGEPKEFEREILEGMEAGNRNRKETSPANWVDNSEAKLKEAKLLYGKGNKALAYHTLGQALYARMQTVPATVQISTIISATKDAVAGFYQLMNRPLSAQLPVKDDGSQGETPLAKLDRELKQAKSTTTAIALIESIADAAPQTDEDVAILGLLMDKYPVQGQKALARAKDPKLAKAVMKECDRQANKLKNARSKHGNLTINAREDYLNSYLNSAAAINTLAKLNNKDAIPLLRSYLQDESLSRFASVALGRLGDEESLNTMLANMGHGKEVDLSGYGDKGLVRVAEELNNPVTDDKRKEALIAQIKGSANPERKRLLKDLALNHKNPRVRDRSGLALLNSIMVNSEPGDNAFIAEWVGRTKNDETGYWAVTSIRVSHGNGASPLDKDTIALLVDVLRTSTYLPTRDAAAESLGMFRIQEALPYLEECITKDKDHSVRGQCTDAYFQISGKIPPIFHPDDAVYIEKMIKNPEYAQITSGFMKNSPTRLYREALQNAVKEYRRNHPLKGE